MTSFDSLFEFWKIPKCELHVNREKPVERKILRLKILDEIRPKWLDRGEEVRVFFPRIYRGEIRGEPLVYFEDDTPAVVRQGDRIIYNFDPQETINFLIFEQYYEARRPFYTHLPFHYHRVPRSIRAALNKLSSREKCRCLFPSWPVEKSVEAIRGIFLKSVELAGGNTEHKPFWPESRSYCITLTHDVDSGEGFKNILDIAEVEQEYGVTSCWNIVSNHYRIEHEVLEMLVKRGHEIGHHGYNHDNKIAFLKKEQIRERFKNSRTFLDRYSVAGFRSPSLLRSKNLFEVLAENFVYDSSVPDTEKMSQISACINGCCTVFPYMISELVELPITVPQDAALLKENKPNIIYDIWSKKVEWIKKVGGLAVVDTHSDPYFAGNDEMLAVYDKLLKSISKKEAWIANPNEVAVWWKRRKESA